MTTSIYLSHSDIQLFLRCRRAFLYSYVNQYNAPEPVVGALALGTRVHASLEGWYRDRTDPIQVHDRLAAEAIRRCEQEVNALKSWDLDQLYKDVVVSRNCVAAYMDWLEQEGEDQGLTPIGVERKVEAPILDGRVVLRAKLDVEFKREDDSIIPCDFKTTGYDLGRTRAELERSMQIPLYDLILQLNYPESRIVAGEYRVIKKVAKRQSGKPTVERFRVPGLIKRRPTFRANVEGVCQDIINFISSIGTMPIDRIAYPSPAESCAWCEWRLPCLVASEDATAADEMLVSIYGADRHARYDVAN